MSAAKCVGRGEFDCRYIVEVVPVSRRSPLARRRIRSWRTVHTATAIEDDALGRRVAVNAADHIFEFRCQRRGLGNTVVVDD